MTANEVDLAEYERLRKESPLEALLLSQIRALGLPEPEREVRLISGRRNRTDFVYRVGVTPPLAIEVEGGMFVMGRHNRPAGFEADCEKYNEIALLGFRVLRFTGDMVEDGRAAETLQRALTLSGYLSTPTQN
jgi:very-short-patch-repair endonuclease